MFYMFFVLLLFKFGNTSEEEYQAMNLQNYDEGSNLGFVFWSSPFDNMRRKRGAEPSTVVQKEGGDEIIIDQSKTHSDPQDKPGSPVSQSQSPPAPPLSDTKNMTSVQTDTSNRVNNITTETVIVPLDKDKTPTSQNATASEANLSAVPHKGVIVRGLIVFGGFSLLASAYYIFFKRNKSQNDASNTHNNADSNQFRYGVLHSDDQRDNLELSRMPLTMDSDEDDDDDLEIFDLEQKKKSLSYVNLQPNDDEFDMANSYTEHRSENDRGNLLLDIEDRPSDTLINWSSSSK